jgi:putative (di)nucleoside polyphosphate hydrolase
MLLKGTDMVFIGKRIDARHAAWQMPQGGIDADETVIEAGLRELYEETGVKSAEILYESKNWYYYDLPSFLVGKLWDGKYRGQKQKWLLARFTGQDSEITVDTESPEFENWKWMSMSELPKIAVRFKRTLYKEVTEEFSNFLASSNVS